MINFSVYPGNLYATYSFSSKSSTSITNTATTSFSFANKRTTTEGLSYEHQELPISASVRNRQHHRCKATPSHLNLFPRRGDSIQFRACDWHFGSAGSIHAVKVFVRSCRRQLLKALSETTLISILQSISYTDLSTAALKKWSRWAHQDLNLEPRRYEHPALTIEL